MPMIVATGETGDDPPPAGATAAHGARLVNGANFGRLCLYPTAVRARRHPYVIWSAVTGSHLFGLSGSDLGFVAGR